MKPKGRFIQSILKTASQNKADMPWTRGSRRVAMVTRRNDAAPLQVKSA